MSARDEMLATIRSLKVPAAELPPLDGPWITFEDRVEQFSKVLTGIGGQVIVVADVAEMRQRLSELAGFVAARKVASTVSGLQIDPEKTVVDLAATGDPHELADLDFAILAGQFGVAENGAVWVTDEGLRQRVTYFVTQHLALVVEAAEMVNNMHEAYERIEFGQPGFGMFLAGPSKTADIEQSLVIGAQGARSMTVFLIRS